MTDWLSMYQEYFGVNARDAPMNFKSRQQKNDFSFSSVFRRFEFLWAMTNVNRIAFANDWDHIKNVIDCYAQKWIHNENGMKTIARNSKTKCSIKIEFVRKRNKNKVNKDRKGKRVSRSEGRL